MATISNQTIYNRVKKHLLTQGKKSVAISDNGEAGICLYRGPNDTSCAVGCLIKDKFYSRSLENKSINADCVREAVCLSLGIPELQGSQLWLLRELQSCHDTTQAQYWGDTLRSVAKQNGLKP